MEDSLRLVSILTICLGLQKRENRIIQTPILIGRLHWFQLCSNIWNTQFFDRYDLHESRTGKGKHQKAYKKYHDHVEILVNAMNRILKDTRDGKLVAALISDFSKAFDRLHRATMMYLHFTSGLRGPVLHLGM